MAAPFAEVGAIDYPIIDADAHVYEPPDVWQERVPARWRARAPRVARSAEGDAWLFDDGARVRPVGLMAAAGASYLDFRPDGLTYGTIRGGCFDPHARLADMAADGIAVQLLYPSVCEEGARMFGDDRELQLACVRAYNEWLREFCAAAPGRLFGHAVIPATGVNDAVAAIGAGGGRATAVACDVSDAAQVEQAVDTAVGTYGGLDVLVNNAARNRPAAAVTERVADLDPAWWAATMDVNLTGVFRCCQAALRVMVARGGGCIVNIASTSGLAGNTNQGAYAASKHGVVGLTKSIALDYAAHGVRAVAICPGFIETERSLRFVAHNRGEGWLAQKRAEIPLGRLGRPEDVAALAVFLASDEAAFITGAVIPIDGGTAARR